MYKSFTFLAIIVYNYNKYYNYKLFSVEKGVFMSSVQTLKPGNLIEIELQRIGESTKLKTVIDTAMVDNTLTILSPMDKGKTVPLHVDERIKVIYIVENADQGSDVYAFKAKVVGRVSKGNVQITKLVKTGKPEKVQRREFFRLGLVKTLDIVFEDKVIAVLTKDISGGGMRGYCSSRVPVQSIVQVRLPMKEGKLITVSGKVIDCSLVNQSNSKFDIRITFSEINKREKSDLITYIYSKQSEVLKGQLRSKLGDEYSIEEGQFGSYYNQSFANRITSLLPLINWFFTLYLVTVVVQSKPATHSGMARKFGIYIAEYWDLEVLQGALPWALVIIVIGLIGTLLKNTTDSQSISKSPINFIIQIIIAFAVIAFYYIMLGLATA